MSLRFYCLLVFLAPIVTYILGPNEAVEVPYYKQQALEEGSELCENVIYLGEFLLFVNVTGSMGRENV